MSHDEQPAWAKAMEERLVGRVNELPVRLDVTEHRVTGAVLKLIAESEERLTRRLDRLSRGDPKPQEACQ